MSSHNKTQVSKNLAEKTILVSRTFNAPLADVWRAYTESELLDQWWGPEPWRAETKFMDFKPGGYWLYAMVGPGGERHWARMNYETIIPQKEFKGEDGFCDENGNMNTSLPVSKWTNTFTKTEAGTLVQQLMKFTNQEDLQKIVDMGFEEGMSIGLDQLEALLSKQTV